MPHLAVSASAGSRPGATTVRGDLKNPSNIRAPDTLRA